MSVLGNAVAAHNAAAADRARAEREMGSRWRDAGARIVETRFLQPLTVQDREYARALAAYDTEVDRALRLVDEHF